MSVSFRGTENYVASPELMGAVDIAVALQKPLLIKGEPGTGKTMLAAGRRRRPGQEAHHLEHQVHHQGAGRSVRLRRGPASVRQPVRRRRRGRHRKSTSSWASWARHSPPTSRWSCSSTRSTRPIWSSPTTSCGSWTRWSSTFPRQSETVKAKHRPIVIITSNAEKELPDAFLRRCIFHYIAFPDAGADGRRSSASTSTSSTKRCSHRRCRPSIGCARLDSIEKKPSTSELVDWLQRPRARRRRSRAHRKGHSLCRRTAQKGQGHHGDAAPDGGKPMFVGFSLPSAPARLRRFAQRVDDAHGGAAAWACTAPR